MERTRKQIIDQCSRMLSVVGVGENIAPGDFNIIADTYDGLHERMLQNNNIYWSDSNCVPIESAGLMVAILSGTVVTEDSDFGLADDEILKITSMQERAKGELNKLINDSPSGERVRFKSY